MPVDDAPDDHDDSVRQSYNFAPGYRGLVYRADGGAHKLQAMKWGPPPAVATPEQHADPPHQALFPAGRSAAPTAHPS